MFSHVADSRSGVAVLFSGWVCRILCEQRCLFVCLFVMVPSLHGLHSILAIKSGHSSLLLELIMSPQAKQLFPWTLTLTYDDKESLPKQWDHTAGSPAPPRLKRLINVSLYLVLITINFNQSRYVYTVIKATAEVSTPSLWASASRLNPVTADCASRL